jgi:cytosine/uracil/thiamine/allantoin permease
MHIHFGHSGDPSHRFAKKFVRHRPIRRYTPRPMTSAIVELDVDLSHSRHFSADMAPTTRAQRKWAMKDLAALWISMAACVPTYMLASSLIERGMN